MEIKGKYATAVVFARVIDDGAAEQIRRMCDCVFTSGSRIRIMPDVHAGKGCTIGTTMTVHGKAVPNVVGVDIGCGMYTVRLKEREADLAAVDGAAHFIPSGMRVWDGPRESFDLGALRCLDGLKNPQRLRCGLGTLGGGNHFIEIDRASDGVLYLVIHSGSRNLGKQVAEYYQRTAVRLCGGGADGKTRREALIAEYRAAGRRTEIARALEEMEKDERERAIPDDLCYLSGQALEDYLHDVEVCQEFARRSREHMAAVILSRAGLTGTDAFHTVHNYIDTKEMILRKGAIAAHKGERVLIPINMRDGSVLAVGRGNPDWNYSAPHGAGRLMSRSEARKTLSLADYRDMMRGVYSTSVDESTLDEAPMAYKPLADIIGVIRDAVDIVDIMKPVYNFKASEEGTTDGR